RRPMGPAKNLPEMFRARAARYGARTRYRAFQGGAWQDVSWHAMAASVDEIAAGLIALGLEPGERAAIFAATSPRWVEIDLAIQSAGGVTVPVYSSNVANEAGFILLDSGARVVFVDGPATLAKVRDTVAAGVTLDDGSANGTGDVLPLAELRRLGRERGADDVARRVQAIEGGQVATIVYTSGTTGSPKGVVQTHQNHLAMLESCAQLDLLREGDVDFFFLPLAHSFARFVSYFGIHGGSVTAFARSIDTLAEDIRATQPTVIPAVPRIYEKIRSRIEATAQAGGALRRALFDWAVSVGRRRSAHLQAKEPVPGPLALQYAIADRLVFRRIRELMGGRVRLMISGAAPLAREVMEFFHAAGLLILEGYGLTETTPALTINRPNEFKFGTVGKPVPGVEIRLAADGEILARGANVAQGYHRRPAETAEAWDADGWFHTGDIGDVDAQGFLRITDRKKDLIKTSGGKYVAPQKIENMLK